MKNYLIVGLGINNVTWQFKFRVFWWVFFAVFLCFVFSLAAMLVF